MGKESGFMGTDAVLSEMRRRLQDQGVAFVDISMAISAELGISLETLWPVTSFRAETYGSQTPSRRAESCQADEPVHKAGGPDSKVTCPLGNREERGTKACSGAVGPRGVTDIQVETVGSYSKGAREN